MIVLAASLQNKGPEIKLLRELAMNFIVTAKEGDPQTLFQEIRMYDRLNDPELVYVKVEEEKFHHQFRFKNNVLLNAASNQKITFSNIGNTRLPIKPNTGPGSPVRIASEVVTSCSMDSRILG